MKKIFILSLAVILSAVVLAAPRSQQKALQEARRFLQQKGLHQLSDLRIAHKAPRKTGATGDASYYVFNQNDGKGFVIVSGDDRTPAILAYSDSGTFVMDNMPAHIKAWMDGYAEQIRLLDEGKATARLKAPKHAEISAKRSIPEMLTCRWNQSSPYNDLCPSDNGGQCVTGCVATAMAQVMYYHRANSVTATTATIPSYTPFGSSTTVEGVAAGAPIDWNNMIDVYNSTSTDAQNTAVAQLMNYCGRSVEMTYSSDASGAQSSMIPVALKKYFRYAADTRIDYSINHDADEWEQIIYDELAAGRPVLYAGNSIGGGHQFVIDGYDTDGLFHVNWGWGGMSNGYFVISILNPDNNSGIGASSTTDGYSMARSAILGAEPAATDAEMTYSGVFTAGLDQLDGNTTYYHYWNQTGLADSFYIGLAAYNEEADTYTILAYYSTGNLPIGVGYPSVTYTITNSLLSSSGLAPGTYRLVPMSGIASEATLYPCQLDCEDIAYVDYTGSSFTVYIEYAGAELEANPIEFGGLTYSNNDVETDITITNNGSKDYNGMVYLFASTSAANKETAASKTNIVVKKQESTRLTLTFKPTSAATYNVWVATDEQGKNVIGQTTVLITNGSNLTTDNSGIEIQSISVDNLQSGSNVLGNKLSGRFTVKNTSSKLFYGNLILRLWFVNYDEGMWYSNVVTSTSAKIEANQTIEIPFSFEDLDYATTYGVSLHYESNYNRIGNIYGPYQLKKAIKVYTSEGEQIVASSSTFNTPASALAVDLSDVDNVTTVTPNGNPNTLYYIDSSNCNPSGFNQNHNVIDGGEAAHLYLMDGYDFFVPKTFTANSGYYQRNMSISTNGSGGWQTLVLPFEVWKVTDYTTGNDIDWFHSATDTDKNFWVKEFTKIADDGTVYFDYTDNIEANLPYIFAVPGDRWGAEWDLSAHTLNFTIANGTTVYATDKLCLASPTYRFEGTMTAQTIDNVYELNAQGSNFALQSSASVPAFRAWFRNNGTSNGGATVLRIAQIGGDNTTAISDITTKDDAERGKQRAIYTIDGCRLNDIPQQKGIYIINGKKVIK